MKIHAPKVFFLGEPTSEFDTETVGQVHKLARPLEKHGRTVFRYTCRLSESESLPHRAAGIATRLLALDTPGSLRGRFFGRQVVAKTGSKR